MQINYFGLLRSPVSWAKIGREIISELIRQNHNVCVFERRGFCYNSKWKLNFENLIKNKFLYDKTLTFEYPLNYKLITSKYKYGMLVYETTELPKHWVENINKNLNVLFLPGEFNKNIFIDAGVKSEIIRIAPYGLNPEIYNYNNNSTIKKNRKFTFLCVCMPQKRKGVDILIRAFEKIFKKDKDTELIIKFPYKPGKSEYDINIKTKCENIKIIEKEYNDEEMVELYKSADCFILPSRAEGFGLIYLEAIACGLPVIATAWGGHCDFLNKENSLLIKYKLIPAGSIQYDNKNGNGLMAEPFIDDLIDKMIYAKKNIEKLKEKIKNVDLSFFYWQNIIHKMCDDILKHLI